MDGQHIAPNRVTKCNERNRMEHAFIENSGQRTLGILPPRREQEVLDLVDLLRLHITRNSAKCVCVCV